MYMLHCQQNIFSQKPCLGHYTLSTTCSATVTFQTLLTRNGFLKKILPTNRARAGSESWHIMTIVSAFLLIACSSSDPTDRHNTTVKAPEINDGADIGIPRYTYNIVDTYPHDPEAFTQGLVYSNGFLFESTGLHGQSSLRKVELTTGRVLKRHNLDQEYFAEGLALVNDRLFQLTFRQHVGFIYNRDSFEPLGGLSYSTEGWGLTHDGSRFIMSDGTPWLYFRDNESFAKIGRIQVTYDGGKLRNLNELEFVNGEIYANLWQTDLIARIDLDTGRVIGWIDLRGLLSVEEKVAADVLNGIAYDANNDRLFVTGKLWPWLFEIQLEETKN